MKYGGQELGHSAEPFASGRSMASMLDAVSASAGLEATFQRREEDWATSSPTAAAGTAPGQAALGSRDPRGIAENEVKLHEASMEHSQEVDDLYKEKFTSLGLYNYLATTLSRLHREAYNVAHELAMMAERAYRFEIDDDEATFIAQDNWQFDKAGLLAGERLSLQLQRLEHAHLQRNTRQYEMTQSFSLAQLDPKALLMLRETGECRVHHPGGRVRPRVPRAVQAADQGRAAHHPLRRRALHERQREADAEAEQGAPRRDHSGRGAGDAAGADHAVHRHEHGPERQRPVRAQLPRRALPAVRGCGRGEHLGARSCRHSCGCSTTTPSRTSSCT